MGILRLGYAEIRVTDMEEAKSHYGRTLGMQHVGDHDGAAYYKGWDEWEHHSLVLHEGGVGVSKFGQMVSSADDLDYFEKKAKDFGARVERMSKGETREVSDGLRITSPSDHVFELYHDMTFTRQPGWLHQPRGVPARTGGCGRSRCRSRADHRGGSGLGRSLLP